MRTLIISVISMAFLVAAAQAGQGQGQGQRQGGDRQGKPGGENRMARMQENLGLSDEQVSQMKEIRQNGGSREEMRSILTEDQRATMDQRRAEHQQRQGQNKGKGNRQGQPPAEESQALEAEAESESG
jgi:Spy/CpxP family protein refolding chaperone